MKYITLWKVHKTYMYSLKNNDPCPLATSSLQKVNTSVVITAFFSSIIVAHTFAPLSNIVYFCLFLDF